MVQRNLKKLLFLMVLMLSVGQAAQATRVYADLAKVTNGNSHGVWNLETKTFTWDAPQNRRILLTGLPDFSEFEYLVLDIQSATGAFRVDFEIPNFDDDNTASYLPGTQFDVTEEAKLLQIPLSELTLTSEQLSSITGVRINANSTQGEVVLNGVYLERDFELVFDEMGKAYIYPSDMTVTGEGMTLDSQTGILTKNAEGAASLTVEFGDVDFSNVTHIDVDVDRTTSPYIDLLAQTMEGTTETGNGHTELKNQANGNIVNWTYSKYNYTLDDQQQANAHNVKSFVLSLKLRCFELFFLVRNRIKLLIKNILLQIDISLGREEQKRDICGDFVHSEQSKRVQLDSFLRFEDFFQIFMQNLDAFFNIFFMSQIYDVVGRQPCIRTNAAFCALMGIFQRLFSVEFFVKFKLFNQIFQINHAAAVQADAGSSLEHFINRNNVVRR